MEHFKSLLNLLQYCFCFPFWFFGRKACGILVPDQGLNTHPWHWKVNQWTSREDPLLCDLNPKGSPTISSWKWRRAEPALPSANPGMSQPAWSFLRAVPKDEEAPRKARADIHHTAQSASPLVRGERTPRQKIVHEWARTFCRTKEGVWCVRPDQALGLAGKRNYTDPDEVMLCSSPAPSGHTSILKRGTES